MSAKRPSAHDLVKPAVEGLVARTQAAARRVIAGETDPEAVHDFRVGLRRLRTVLQASRRLYGRSRLAPSLAALRRFGEATNALRDAEVLGETIALATLDDGARQEVADWLAERAQRERRLRREAVALIAGPELAEALSSLSAVVGAGPRRDEDAVAFAKRRLRRARKGVRALLPVDRSDAERLHRLRIRFKRLRYTAEMLGRFVTELDAALALQHETAGQERVNYAAVAKLAARMQKDLGLLHDADVALEAVAADEELAPPLRRALVDALGALRGRLADRAVAALGQLPSELLGKPIPAARAPERRDDEVTIH